MSTEFGVFIGRFQPFHEGHQFLITEALERVDQLIIVIGSSGRARSTVNPFTYDERVALIRANLQDNARQRVHFVPAVDVFYDEDYWCEHIKSRVREITHEQKVTLLGHEKDASSYYLKEFPEWDYLELPNFKGVSATPLRAEYLLHGLINTESFSPVTQKILHDFKETDAFGWLHAEAEFIKTYKASWSASPYPPIFVTTDTVFICKGHILLIERKYRPGQGLFALPGGFVESNEWIVTGLIRELFEETQIELPLQQIEKSLVQMQVYDYPGRSQIGRVISHVGLFKYEADRLPNVFGSDDAGLAFWMPLDEFFTHGDRLHDDHFQIVQHMWRQGLLS